MHLGKVTKFGTLQHVTSGGDGSRVWPKPRHRRLWLAHCPGLAIAQCGGRSSRRLLHHLQHQRSLHVSRLTICGMSHLPHLSHKPVWWLTEASTTAMATRATGSWLSCSSPRGCGMCFVNLKTLYDFCFVVYFSIFLLMTPLKLKYINIIKY